MAPEDPASVSTADPSAGSGWAGAVPNPRARTVVGVFTDTAASERAYHALLGLGFSGEEVSIVRQGQPAPQMGADETMATEGAATGATAGAILGGIAGLVALAIPGFGPLIAAGPLAVALGSALTGGALGALAGSFAGLGIPKEHAERYEAAVRSGNTVVMAKAADSEVAERITELFASHGAEDVSHFDPTN
jgi:hypothetical protein